MSRSRKNSGLLGLLAALAAAPAPAGIILDQPGAGGRPQRPITSIWLAPGSEAGYLLQRSHAWRNRRDADPKSGARLAFPRTLGEPGSIRELNVRNQLSRANAYRLNRFNK